MPSTIPAAFAEVFEQLGPGADALVDDRSHAAALEAYRDVREAASPVHIQSLGARDYAGRGLMAHALFLPWGDRREAEYVLERVREHMMRQLREGTTPLPPVYVLAEALTRLVQAWGASEREGGP